MLRWQVPVSLISLFATLCTLLFPSPCLLSDSNAAITFCCENWYRALQGSPTLPGSRQIKWGENKAREKRQSNNGQ